MGEWFQSQAAAGSLALAIPVAAIAGLVSFFSPCVIPLLPGYLSYATGLSGADLASGKAGERRGRMLLGSVLFVLGFAVVFVLLGVATGSIGYWLNAYTDQITFVMGLVFVLGQANEYRVLVTEHGTTISSSINSASGTALKPELCAVRGLAC